MTRELQVETIAAFLDRIGASAAGACKLEPNEWRNLAHVAGAGRVDGMTRDAILERLVEMEQKRTAYREVVKAAVAHA
jgi:hypothetical protein